MKAWGRFLLGGLLCASAQGQEPAQAPASESVQEVVVTGSRIPQPNLTSASPIQVVGEQEFKQRGTTDVVDLLNTLPQLFQNSAVDFSNTSNALSTPGGYTTADLRGLGPQRTLVLVDGRRLGTADANTGNPNPSADLDQIPPGLIERVEVVTGGASAAYGSDAIAGVVNFITRKNFEGIQFDAQFGVNQHSNDNTWMQGLAADNGFPVVDGSVRDGQTQFFSVLAGTNFAEGRGNVTGYAMYRHADPVTGSDRDFASCQLVTATLNQGACAGSSSSNWFGLTDGSGSVFSVQGNEFVPWGGATSPPPLFNSNAYTYLSRANERYMAGVQAHVDVTEQIRPYFEFSFMNDRTHSIVAPSGLFRLSNPLEASTLYRVNCGNPLLSAQQAGILCTPGQITADDSVLVDIGRRNIEGGGRDAFYDHTNFRGVGGVRGDLGENWNYDAYGQYYYTSLFNSNANYLNFQSIAQALNVGGTADAPVCVSGPPCVPYNIFKEGGVTAEQLAFLYTPGTARGDVTQKILHADATGDLGAYGLKLPTAESGVMVNIGLEHRSEFLAFDPDAAELAGNLAGFSGASVSIHNGYSVREAFAEVQVPLVQGRPGIQELALNGGYRYSDYSTAGKTNTYKLEMQYAPIEDVRFRGSYQRAVRAPNIIELFNPQAYGQQSFLGVDPCAPTRGPGNVLVPASASLADCQHTGVTPAQYGNGGTTNSIPQCVSNQCGQVIGGNPDLSPEEANTYSIGASITPSALPNFTGSVDYYSIRLKDAVGAIPGAFLFQQCLANANPTYCSQVVRSSLGALTGSSVESGGYILQTSVNVGAAKLSGVDAQASYKWTLPRTWGALSANLNGAYLLETTATPLPGAHTYDCAGLFGTTCQTVNPVWRHNLRVNWDTSWKTLISLQWRYISKVKLDNNDSDESLFGAEFDGEINNFNGSIGAANYFDLSAIYTFRPGLMVRAGINNLFDRNPQSIATELSGTGGPNTYPTYDILGRQAFLGVTAQF